MKASSLRNLAFTLFVPVLPSFFYAWGEYHKHATLLLQDENYTMPWEVLLLNIFWAIPLVGSTFLLHLSKNKAQRH